MAIPIRSGRIGRTWEARSPTESAFPLRRATKKGPPFLAGLF